MSLFLVSAVVLPVQSCATIAGTLVSPITGAVDLPMQTLYSRQWYLILPVGLAGLLGGPVVAIYNGVNYDAKIFNSWDDYWQGFHQVFKPYEMLLR